MTESFYKEAWDYTMQELQKEYIQNKNEDEFKMWFNMQYVEDTIDSITVSVASPFMQQFMLKKNTFEIVRIKFVRLQDKITL